MSLFTFRLGLALLCLLCAGESSAADATALRVFTSILPAEYLAARIGGGRVKAESLVQPGHNPHTYSPTPRQMARLSGAQLFLRIGVPFEEPLIAKMGRSVPELKIIDLRQGIDLLPMTEEEEEGHGHGDDLDPHTWLDPLLALRQAETIHNALVKADPAGKEEYDRNLAALATDLRELDLSLRRTLAPLAGRTVYVFHPAYGYFCRAYNLRQKAINVQGKETGARHLARLIEEAKRDRVRIIFVQPQFSEKTADAIARSIGGSVVALDPLARDYLANMAEMARSIAASLGETAP